MADQALGFTDLRNMYLYLLPLHEQRIMAVFPHREGCLDVERERISGLYMLIVFQEFNTLMVYD